MSEESEWLEEHRNPAMEGTEFDSESGRYICPNCGGRGNMYMSGHRDSQFNLICPPKPAAAPEEGA